MRYALLKSIDVGKGLIPVVKQISQDKIDAFAVSTGSTGAIHVDPKYCAQSSLKKTLAHGFLTMAYVSEMMEINFGLDWTYTGYIEVKFIGQAHPGDTVVTKGVITQVEERTGKTHITCSLSAQNQEGKDILVGSASLTKENQNNKGMTKTI